jgi:PAS domain S-box-containing protein
MPRMRQRNEGFALSKDSPLAPVTSLVDVLPGAFAVVDEDGICAAATAGFCALLGRTRSEVVGAALEIQARWTVRPFSPGRNRTWRLVDSRETGDRSRARSNDDLLAVIVNTLPVMINGKDTDSRYLFMNRFQAEHYGVAPEDAIGRSAEEILGSEYGSYTRELDRRAIATGEPLSFYDENYPDADGALHDWLTTKAPMRNDEGVIYGVATVAAEISQRKELEAKLHVAERDYRSLFNNAIDGIYRSSLEGRQLRANPALVELNGYDSEEEMLAAVRNIATEWYVERGRRDEFMRILHRDGIVANFVSEVYRHKTRERIWVSENARLIRDDEGRPLFYEGTVRDITEFRRAEEALRAAMAEVEAASLAKSNFLANISHELRTPLNAIIGFSEIMQNQMLGPIENATYLGYASDIYDSGTHLLGLINEILDLSKAEAGRMEINDEFVDVPVLVERCVATLRPQADKARIILGSVASNELPALRSDRARLRQILVNLLSNAIKFTPERGKVTVTASIDADRRFAISVVDTGIGMSPEQIPIALEPFRQIDSALNRAHGGTGLGLPLTKRLIELHGGTLEIASVLGRGTTVTVRFPRARVGQH